jgi:hypothetical protein
MFHYTTVDALKSILENEELWLSHYRYMNDHQEFFYTFNKAKKVFLEKSAEHFIKHDKFLEVNESEKQQLAQNYLDSGEAEDNLISSINKNDIYIGSFCKTGGDLLSQWRGYTSGDIGYCIEFDEKKLKNKTTRAIVDCKYDDGEAQITIDKLSEEYTNQGIGLSEWLVGLVKLCLYSKHHGFEEENEKRIIVIGDAETTVLFRSKKGILVPYIPFEFDKEAIKSITIGPTKHQEICKKSLEMLLKSLQYKDIKIKLSETPLTN